MRLAETIVIAPEKITGYLLIERSEDDKSKYLASLGFTAANPHHLELELRRLATGCDSIEEWTDRWGTRHRITALIVGPSGKRSLVRTIWIYRLSGKFEFVTLYPEH